MGEVLVAALGATLCIFGVSAVGRLGRADVWRGFTRSLRDLRFISTAAIGPVAVLVTAAECAIALGSGAAIVSVVGGRPWAPMLAVISLVVAMGLLVVLTGGIVLALRRRSMATCACFGASSQPLSRWHVLRNALMALVVVVGVIAAFPGVSAVDPLGAGLALVAGGVVASLLIRLDEIIELFVPAGLPGRARVGS